MKKRTVFILCFILMCLVSSFIFTGEAEAKTTTKVYKENPTTKTHIERYI